MFDLFDERTPAGVLSLLADLKRERGERCLDDVDMWGWKEKCHWFRHLPVDAARDFLVAVLSAKKPRLPRWIKVTYLRYFLLGYPDLDALRSHPPLAEFFDEIG